MTLTPSMPTRPAAPRVSSAVALALFAMLAVAAPAIGQGTSSWLGKRVVLTSTDAKLKIGKRGIVNGNQHRVYRIGRVHDAWLWAEADDVSGWVRAADVVAIDQAVDHFTRRIRAKADDPTLYNLRGLVRADLGDLPGARADFAEAIRRAPRYAAAFNNRGLAWKADGQPDRAVADFSRAIRLAPTFAEAYFNRGSTRLDRDEVDRALIDLTEAIRLAPRDAVSHTSRGLAWRAKGDPDRALADFDLAVRLAPDEPDSFFNRAIARADTQDFDGAFADGTRCLKLDPSNAPARINRAGAALVTARADAGPDARAYLDRVGWEAPLAPYAALIGHFGFRRSGRADEARRLLDEAAMRGDPASWPAPIVRYLRGEIDEPSLLAAAGDDTGRATLARAYLGLDHALAGRTDRALPHLRWVRDRGHPRSDPVSLARAELARLGD